MNHRFRLFPRPTARNDKIVCDIIYYFNSFCDKAKDLLKARNIAYEAIELDYFANPAPFVAELIEFTNQKTVPNIFINGNHFTVI